MRCPIRVGLPFVLAVVVLLPAVRYCPAQARKAPSSREIDLAIQRGVEYFKSSQNPDGTWPGNFGHRLGGIALAGLALREAGVSADDPVIQRVNEQVRDRSPTEMRTYDVALCIMFLDKMTRTDGKSSELRAGRGPEGLRAKKLKSGRILVGRQVAASELIVRLGQRLQNGQGPKGSWTYGCGGPADGDHSNTQFGVLGLWVAGQHGLDVGENLRRCAEHFLTCQDTDGGWGYRYASGSTHSMTCAGLIALAAAAGMEMELTTSRDVRNPRAKGRAPKNEPVQAGLKRLESYLPRLAPDFGREVGGLGGLTPVLASPIWLMGPSKDLYFFWSLERVGVLYGLDKIGRADWYRWGSERLLRLQRQDGSWSSWGCQTVGTSFALLFLTRANVSPELSELLTGKFGAASSQMKAGKPGTDPMQALGLKASVSDLFNTLAAKDDGDRRQAVLEELAARRPKYSEIKDQLAEICQHALSRDKDVARAARDQLANAFQRAPVSHCLYWLGEADKSLAPLIWRQVDARIARADGKRRKEYADTAVTVLGNDGFSTTSRKAAIELLTRLKDRQSVEKVVELLLELPRELYPDVGKLLGDLTGQDFGPRSGDGIAGALEAKKKWEAWLGENGP